ncbi:hypothetical protein EV641_104181 [Rhodococcus sp. SMB37]|uniref:lipid droplet-associated protein n=1 Tax=Rhodococcus sp. SMB37 TaxID=2512213 RepID=UPI0010498047|nr:lipid droplet-associated protein [Rhodococcus sp. SMB37]TCN54916.1 hypothetical protein EV641_104181 [Rhodococcus sp. SMB37]
MIRPPFMARVAAGVAVTAYEETLRLPSTAVALPMTTVSQILQTAMRMQQVMTGLAIKGDQLFEVFGSAPAEEPEWAVFDEDEEPLTGSDASGKPVDSPASASAAGRFALYSAPPDEVAGKGRPATAPTSTESSATAEPKAPAVAEAKKAPAKKAPAKKTPAKKATATRSPAKSAVTKASPAKKSADKPAAKAAPASASKPTQPAEIAEYLDYDALTLAQLRARLRTLSVEDLTALLAYENANAGRAPFVTMLSNRISSAERK